MKTVHGIWKKKRTGGDSGPKIFNCDYCDRTFRSKCRLEQHTQAKPGAGIVLDCVENFSRKFLFLTSFRFREQHEGNEYECDICRAKFSSRMGLKHHRNGFETCDSVFSTDCLDSIQSLMPGKTIRWKASNATFAGRK